MMMVGLGYDEIVTVVIAAVVVVQSLFGVGVLFLGTPILMLLGLPFFEILGVLFPVSFSINLIQAIMGRSNIQWMIVKRFLSLSLPMTVLGTVILQSLVHIAALPYIIALYLGLVSIGLYFNAFPQTVKRWMNFENPFLATMGFLHGLTNLGGPLLSSFVVSKFPEKQQSRATVAVCYGLFVLVQFSTLLLSGAIIPLFGSFSAKTSAVQVLLSVGIFIIIDRWVFQQMSNRVFKQIFGWLLMLMSVLLLLRDL
jgi:hypothetical protein